MRILSIFFLCAAISACDGCGQGRNAPDETANQGSKKTEAAPVGEKVVCPVCGLTFDSSEAAATYDYEGKKYYFLLEDHMKAFATDPKSYVGPDKPN